MLKEKEVSVEWDQVEELERIDQEGSAGADQGSLGEEEVEEVEEVDEEQNIKEKTLKVYQKLLEISKRQR